MADSDLRATAVWEVARFKAARYAVLTPTVKDWKHQGVIKSMDKLRAMWRSRLHDLHNKGWFACPTKTDMQYMRNCPPFGVLTNCRTLCCRRSVVCPFCFARSVVIEAFSRIELAVYGSHDSLDEKSGQWKVADDKYRLVAWWSKGLFPRPPGDVGWEPIKMEKEVLPFIVNHRMRPGRTKEIDKLLPVVAGTVLLRAEIEKEGVTVRRSGIAVLDRRPPKEIKPDGALPGQHHYEVHRTFDKKTLAQVCGRVLRYPAGLLQRGDTDEVVMLLNAMKNFRTVSHYGERLPKSKSHFLGVPDEEEEAAD